MRRLMLLAAGLIAVTGCSDVKQLFTAHADVAAEAGRDELSTERLATILSGGKGVRITPEAAEFVASVWTDYSLFAQSVATGDLLGDSTTIAAAMWPVIAEMRSNQWHDTLLARRSTVTPAQVDSVYRGNDVRVFQHILVQFPPNADAAGKAEARRKAEDALRQVRAGGDFGALAARLSEDRGSAADQGFLPPSPRGAWVPPFDSAAWRLAPGATTGLVETQYGYHIIHRPAADAVAPRLRAYLDQARGTLQDSIYMDSLGIVNELELASDAPAAMRAAAQDPESHADSDKELVDFKDGGLTVGEFLRWVRALPPQYLQQVKTADDAQLKLFARALGQNELLLRQADSAGIRIGPAEWQLMMVQYRAQIDTLRREIGLTGDVTDSTVAEKERLELARMKVSDYFDRLVEGKARLRPLPATLGTVLRERSEYELHPAGLSRAVELAQEMKAKADSASGGAQPGPMRPAPGPAPVPGAEPPAGGDTAQGR